jgi:hypothetical protein
MSFPLIFQNVLSDRGSRVWSIEARRGVLYYPDSSAGFSLVVWMEVLS